MSGAVDYTPKTKPFIGAAAGAFIGAATTLGSTLPKTYASIGLAPALFPNVIRHSLALGALPFTMDLAKRYGKQRPIEVLGAGGALAGGLEGTARAVWSEARAPERSWKRALSKTAYGAGYYGHALGTSEVTRLYFVKSYDSTWTRTGKEAGAGAVGGIVGHVFGSGVRRVFSSKNALTQLVTHAPRAAIGGALAFSAVQFMNRTES
jgi:hypothetical protein